MVEQSRDLERLQPLQVGRVVAALDLLAGRGCAFGRVEALEQDGEPLSRLDVRLRRVELSERRVAYEFRRTASASVSRSTPSRWARPTR